MKLKIKNGDTMTVRFAYEYSELDALAEFLEEKAAEGWQLTSKTGIILGFRRCKARKVKVAVEMVYADDNDLDNERLIEYCQAAGWRHVFSDGKVQIFETEDLDAEPIHTDPVLKLAAVHRKAKKMQLWLPVIALILGGLWMKFFWSHFSYRYFFSNGTVLAMFGMPVLLALLALQIGVYLRWYVKAKRLAESGQAPDYHRKRFTGIADKIMLVYIFGGIWGSQLLDAYFSGIQVRFVMTGVTFAAILLLIVVFPFFSARFGKERRGNFYTLLFIGIALSLVFEAVGGFLEEATENDAYVETEDGYVSVYQDKLPLTMEDLGIETGKFIDRYCDRGGSFFVRHLHGSDSSDNEENYSLSYDAGIGNADKLCAWLMEEQYNPKDFIQVDDGDFGAVEVYLLTGNTDMNDTWVLKYADRAVLLCTDIPLTPEQKQIIGRKFMDLKL